MKFWKILKNQIKESPPGWQDQFLSYKELKKRLKLNFPSEVGEEAEDATSGDVVLQRPRIESQGSPESVAERRNDSCSFAKSDDSNDCSSSGSNPDDDFNDIEDISSRTEFDFIELLNPELVKFNAFFGAKQEEYIVRQKELQERIEKVRNTVDPSSKYDMIKVCHDAVKFHGEMVLLENYSILNFTGLVKITKKYDKRTGGISRLAFIQKVLEQPFFTMDLLFKLVKQCEETLHNLISSSEEEEEGTEEETEEEEGTEDETEQEEGSEGEAAEYLGQDELSRSIMAALHSTQEMRKGSSTYSPFSLPPLHHDMPPSPSK